MADFGLSAATLALWVASGIVPATDAEILEIETLAQAPLPPNYVLFLKTYGFASWVDASEVYFDTGTEQGDIFALMPPSQVARSIDYAPTGFLPIAGDYSGHALILLRMTPPTGSVWYIYDDGPAQFVQDDWAEFLVSLRANPSEPKLEQWQGTPVMDSATGFTIADETRSAWQVYGTGATPEPADELASIETALDRPLPEALRTFLTHYGYVTYFGEAIASFALPPETGREEDAVSVIYSTTVLRNALPVIDGAPLPFASTELMDGSLLIGLTPTDEGQIYWRPDADMAPVKIAEDLRSFLASLYVKRPVDD